MARRLVAALVLASAAFAWAGPAAANDPAAATVLFNDAKRLVGAGMYSEACPKFEESQRLDPGIGTQFNLADCYEHVGRTASAWATYLDVASAARAAGQSDREVAVRARIAALEPKLSKLTITVAHTLDGLEVKRNGEVVGSALWGNAVPVDPGKYLIEATAPGKKKWSTETTVGPDGAVAIETVPDLENQDGVTGATGTVALGGGIPAPSPEQPQGSSSQRTIGLVVGGAGVVALGIGTVFGLKSMSKHSDYTALCTGNVCKPEAQSIHDQAVSAGNVSTIGFVAGLLLTGGGVALWLTAPRPATAAALYVRPLVGAAGGGAALGGDW